MMDTNRSRRLSRRATVAVAFTVALASLTFGAAAPATAASAPVASFNPTGGARNVALLEAGTTVVATSSSSGSQTPHRMLNYPHDDGYWHTTSNTGQYVIFSLIGATPWMVDRVAIRPRPVCCSSNARVKDFAIDVSTTGTAPADFTTVLTATTADDANLQTFALSAPVLARYVRYRPLTNRGGCCGIMTNQLKIYSGQHSTSPAFTFVNHSTDPDGDPMTFEWAVDGAPAGTSTDLAHTFAAAGPHAVGLTATDSTAASDTTGLDVRVLTPPAVSFAFSPADPNEGQSVQFCDTSADPDGAIIYRIWNWGDGSFPTATASTCTSHAFGDNATYTVKLTAVDDQETVGSHSIPVTPNNLPPVVNVFGDRRWVAGERLLFGVSTTDPGWRDSRTCVWQHGDGTTRSSCSTFDHAYAVPFGSPPETFTATLTATDDDGGVGSDSLDVTVYPQVFDFIPSAAVNGTGLDWSRVAGRLVATRGGPCVNELALVSLDGTLAPLPTGDLAVSCNDSPVAVSDGAAGFSAGDVFLGNGSAGQIVRVRLSASGTVLGVDRPWTTVSSSGRFEGGLAFDDVGAFDGELLGVLTDGRVYRIAADGSSALVANVGRALFGADVAGPELGPVAGCVLTTDGWYRRVLAVCPDGSVRTLTTIPTSATLGAVTYMATAGSFFYADPGSDAVGEADSRAFGASVAGRALVATTSGGEIWAVSYDATTDSFAASLHTLAVHGSYDAIEQIVSVPAIASQLSTLTPAAATALVGESHTVTARIVDASGHAVAGLPITFEVTSGPNAGTTGTATTDGDGRADFAYLGAAGAGTDTIVARSSSVAMPPVTVAWTHRDLELHADAALLSFDGELAVVHGARATLRDARTQAPVAGRTVTFTTTDAVTGAPTTICVATTDASGVAACSTPTELLTTVAGGRYTASFGGDATYAPASDDAPLVRIRL